MLGLGDIKYLTSNLTYQASSKRFWVWTDVPAFFFFWGGDLDLYWCKKYVRWEFTYMIVSRGCVGGGLVSCLTSAQGIHKSTSTTFILNFKGVVWHIRANKHNKQTKRIRF